MEKLRKGSKVYLMDPSEPLQCRIGYISEKISTCHKETFPGDIIHNVGSIFLAATLSRNPTPSDCRYLMKYAIYDEDIVPEVFWLSEFPKSFRDEFRNIKEAAVLHPNKVDFCIKWYRYLRNRLHSIEDYDCPKASAPQLRDMLKSMDYCLKVIQESK